MKIFENKISAPARSFSFALLAGIALLLSSCGANRKAVYFQDANTIARKTKNDLSAYQIRIAPNDILQIMVSAPNPESVKAFNDAAALAVQGDMKGYLVDEQGYINGVPLIGQVRLGGLTKAQAAEALEEKISEQVLSPTVSVRIANFKVTVLGEVRAPGVYTVASEKVTLPEAIGMAGDLTIFGKRNDILLCRNGEQGQEFYRIDLTSADIFYSPYYYLQQGDLIYVSPNKTKTVSGQINPVLPVTLSVLSFLIGIVTLVRL